MKDWALARRSLLKSLGVGAACLPLLRAGRARGASAHRRLMVIELIQGYRQAVWRPVTGSLLTQPLPTSSAAFEAVKGDMIFLPDLTNPGIGSGGRGAYGVMFYGLGATGAGQYKEPTGPTIDQFVANALPLAPGGRRSLNLAVQIERAPRATVAPGGDHCFWAGAGQPINPLLDPYAVYQELFTGPGTDAAAARRLMARRKSILDYVGSNLEDFRSRAGTDDRQLIDGHLQSIRDLEGRLQSMPAAAACGPKPVPMIDLEDSASYPKILDAHLRLMVAALKCGITNVATLQTSDAAGSSINFGAFVPGLPAMSVNNYKSPYRNWTDLSRNPVLAGVDHKAVVERWFFERFADTFAQMKAVPEDDGTMLDNTIVIIGNDMQDGASHDTQRIPWMLAGNCNGRLAVGNCLPSAGHPIASVMAGICDALAVKHPYGDALPGLEKP
jgi:hypothetical protein